jgi:hypothetical protein
MTVPSVVTNNIELYMNVDSSKPDIEPFDSIFYTCIQSLVLCDGPIPRTEESYRLQCGFECDQAKIKTLYTYCEQVGRRGKDYETKRYTVL